MVTHRVGFTGGPFWTGVSFRLFLCGFKLVFFVSKPVQIGSWGCKRREEPIGTDVEPKNNQTPQKQSETKPGPKQNPRKANTSGMGSGRGWCIGSF
jgi:hypothetical protein